MRACVCHFLTEISKDQSIRKATISSFFFIDTTAASANILATMRRAEHWRNLQQHLRKLFFFFLPFPSFELRSRRRHHRVARILAHRIPQSSSTQSHRSRVQIIQFRLVRASRRSKSGPPVTSGKSFSCSQTRPNTCHEKHGARYAARPRLAAATARNKLVQHDTLAFS